MFSVVLENVYEIYTDRLCREAPRDHTNLLLTLVEYCCSKHISGNESIMRTDAGALVHARRTSAPPSETAFRL